MNEGLYSIQFVSNVTGINPHTIRAWEKRYGATSPARDKNGRRLYSDQEIRRLRALHELVNFGNNISDIANLDILELDNVLEKYSVTMNGNIEELNNTDLDIELTLNNLFMGINFFKLNVVAHELEKASRTMSPLDFSLKIINPVISEIRKLKGLGGIKQIQKEQLYLILKSHLTKKIYNTNLTIKPTKTVLVASGAGQLNELGAMVASIIFLSENYEVEFLGGNVRADILASLSQQYKAEYIFIGLNYSHDSTMSLKEKESYLEKLNKGFYKGSRVLVGAYDYCFQLPSSNMYCFNEFEEIKSFLKKTK
ncbi:MAG: DNA-binding transcriptional MerR regulator [Bacteriovoracaceae bacterium]|jgi:DNA-binding transcriptional MerR regulator